MAQPKQDPRERTLDNIKALEQEPDTKDLQFCEPTPCNKRLFTLTPEENGLLVAIGYSIGPDDSSVNGYAHFLISKVLNDDMYASVMVDNQTMWNKFVFNDGKEGLDRLEKKFYLRKGEPFYIQLASNFPAPAKVLGNLTFYLIPTFD